MQKQRFFSLKTRNRFCNFFFETRIKNIFFSSENQNQFFFHVVFFSFFTNFFLFFISEQFVLSLLDLLQGLQRESKDCEKDLYKNKTRKPNNAKMPSLVSVTISLKQIHRLPGARRSHFDVCFPGYNGGQAVPQHLETAPTN